MKNDNKENIKKYLTQIYQIHGVYKKQNDPKKHQMILEKSQGLVDKLEVLGISRAFSETLLAYGNEFFLFEYKSNFRDYIKTLDIKNGLW